jgi:hypothetical protein
MNNEKTKFMRQVTKVDLDTNILAPRGHGRPYAPRGHGWA